MIIAIDFDGTIIYKKDNITKSLSTIYGKKSGNKYRRVQPLEKLMPLAKETINELYKKGHKIIIWTCRTGKQLNKAIQFLDYESICYHKVNENISFEEIGFKPFPKVYADIYIDDKNFCGFPGWEAVREKLL